MPLSIPDQTIAAQVKPVDVMTPLSSMLNMARGAQAYQQSNDLFPQQLRQQTAEADVAQGTAQPRIDQANTLAQASKFKLQGDQVGLANQVWGGLVSDPDVNGGDIDKMMPKLMGVEQDLVNRGIPPAIAKVQSSHMIAQAVANPKAFPSALKTVILQSQPSTQQSTTIQPSGIAVGNGQQTSVIGTNPFAPGAGAPIPGTTQQQQVPPTYTTMVNGQPQYVGPQPPVAAGQGASIAAGPAVGQVLAAEGPIGTNNAHYSDVVAQGKDAGNRVAQLQSIKEQIPAANMGHGGAGDVWRKLQTIFGSDAATANDIINKNIAMLASSGNTDAARTLQEMQTPNAHVTEKAAQEAADALIGVAKRQQKAVDFFAGTPTNSPAYASKMSQWNSNANPRAFEFALKSPAEQEAMKARMKRAGTWSSLQKQMIGLHNMGVSPE